MQTMTTEKKARIREAQTFLLSVQPKTMLAAADYAKADPDSLARHAKKAEIHDLRLWLTFEELIAVRTGAWDSKAGRQAMDRLRAAAKAQG